MKEQILKLRAEGKTYNQIEEELGCAKSTVCYHCGIGQKEKARIRAIRNKARNINKRVTNPISIKLSNFTRKKYGVVTSKKFDYQKAHNKIINSPYCYLTGKKLNINDGKSFSLDHIKPRIKGGENTVDNMGLICREINYAKRDLEYSEFIDLCIAVCKHNGYKDLTAL